MCKKHSIIRPSIIRGCQWALSGWYITLSCPLPQLGPTQPARHVGNTAGETYSTGQDLGCERCSFWSAFPMIMMPHCKRRSKNYDGGIWDGSVSWTLKEHLNLNCISSWNHFFEKWINTCKLVSAFNVLLRVPQLENVRHDLRVCTCRHLIYHGDDLCNNPSVMKLVTQTAICYWFHANAFDSWWRLALALNGAVSWWVDSFVVTACTLVQTDRQCQ